MSDYVQLQQVKQTANMEKFVATVLPQDLLDTLRQVSAHELLEQANAGNKPSAVLVDGQQKPIALAQRRVVSLYSDAAELARAMHEAFALLERLTRHLTGRAQHAYRLTVNDQVVGDESAVDRAAQGMTNRDRATIIGPLVAYGRRLFWNPATGGNAPRSRTVRRKRGDFRTAHGETLRVYTTQTEPIHQTVARTLSRRYRALTIKVAWFDTQFFRGIGADAGTPGLLIRYKAGRAVRRA